MEHTPPRNDANLGAQPRPDEQVKPGEEFEGSRPGKKTAAAVVLILAAYMAINNWSQISAAFS